VSGRRAIHLVAAREFRERRRSRAFRASTAVQLLAVLGLVAIAVFTGGDDRQEVTVAVVGADERAALRVAATRQEPFDLAIEVRRAKDVPEARHELDEGSVDAVLAGGQLLVDPGTPDRLAQLLQATWRETRAADTLRRAGVDPQDVRRALSTPPLRVRDVTGDDDIGAFAFIGTVLLYIGIFTFGYYVVSGVVEEKSSRVVEVVLSAIRPVHLLTGKVIGIGLLGILQLLVIGGGRMVAALASGTVDFPATTAETAILVALYFVLGYAFYACAFAVAGAIVSRQEDIQSTTAPMSLVLVAGYLASFSVVSEPGSTLARILTILPPVAPFVVPTRAAGGALPAWELAASLMLMMIGTVLVLVVAARIYRRAVLQLGAPMKLSQALGLAR
jgi:ABC-2 type transport system permease protein